MKEEEIRPIAENYVEEYCHLPDGEYTDGSLVCAGIGTALIVSRQLEKRIDELEEKISFLLSCKNCPENKGGLLCQKEYEDKCLAQKIQYIKELKEENAELLCQKNRNKSCYSCANATERCFRNEIGCPCQKYKSWKEENHIPKEFSQLNLPSKEIKERCTKELKEACKRLGLQLGDFTFKVMLAVYWEGKKQGLKEGDMRALDYTLIHFGNNDDLKTEVEALKKCLRGIVYMAESGLHTKNELAFARCIAEAKELCKE